MIENEFGEINIDSELVLSSDEEIFELTNGCVCCVATARADLLRIVEKLLAKRDKYDHILEITEKTSASDLWQSLMAFVAEHQDKKIEEVMLYFSGHGYYQGDARFCGSDFESSRRHSTSVSNAEIDLLLRQLKPRVMVKVPNPKGDLTMLPELVTALLAKPSVDPPVS